MKDNKFDSLASTAVTMRPFLPSKDFEQSCQFYKALGFRVTPLAEKVAHVQLDGTADGSFAFLLQDFYVKEFAENLMMHLLVNDLDRWWQFLQSLSLKEHFGVPAPRPPKKESWGLTVIYVHDPSGVLWHIASEN